LHMSDVTFDMRDNSCRVHQNAAEPWVVTLVDTGERTQTGGRLKRVAPYLDGEDFCFTYGDGLADVDIRALIAFHRERHALATVTAVQPPGRFGALDLDEAGERIHAFEEKPKGDGSWINGGFFVLSPRVLDYIEGDDTVWENGPIQRIAAEGGLCAFRHRGFWRAMDTLRDREQLERLWAEGRAPWKVW
ncbi:MAG: glucose-1-phosphate cytidylyltransferase, partial [Nitrospirae bacterium]